VSWPRPLSIDDVLALGQPPYRDSVHPSLLQRIDYLRRTFESLREVRVEAEALGGQGSLGPDRTGRKEKSGEPVELQSFVNQQIHFLVDAFAFYAHVECCEGVLRAPGLQDLPRFLKAMSKSGCYFYFRTSDPDAQNAAALIRTEEAPVICWFDDSPIGVPTFALGPRFRDASSAHVHR
jgi:hypothetical protein